MTAVLKLSQNPMQVVFHETVKGAVYGRQNVGLVHGPVVGSSRSRQPE